MSPWLLDVNVLIAIIDSTHVHHLRAHRWFEEVGQDEWLSCPTTQNGVVRVVSNARYSNSQPVERVCVSLESLLAAGKHRFIADSISLLDSSIDRSRLLATAQVTDSYLLALAVHNDASLVTFDTRLVTTAVRGGAAALHQIS